MFAEIAPVSLRFLALMLYLGTSFSLVATSIEFPKFSKPVLLKDRLICTSPDSKRLICIGLDGTKRWEKSFVEPVSLFAGRKSDPLLQIGQVVSLLSESGELLPKFTVEDINDKVTYIEESSAFVSNDRRFEKRIFKLIDDKTGKPLWVNPDVESLVCLADSRGEP